VSYTIKNLREVQDVAPRFGPGRRTGSPANRLRVSTACRFIRPFCSWADSVRAAQPRSMVSGRRGAADRVALGVVDAVFLEQIERGVRLDAFGDCLALNPWARFTIALTTCWFCGFSIRSRMNWMSIFMSATGSRFR